MHFPQQANELNARAQGSRAALTPRGKHTLAPNVINSQLKRNNLLQRTRGSGVSDYTHLSSTSWRVICALSLSLEVDEFVPLATNLSLALLLFILRDQSRHGRY
jgi:hypothetical protein